MTNTETKSIEAMIAVDSLRLKSNDMELMDLIACKMVQSNPVAAEFIAQHINVKLATK